MEQRNSCTVGRFIDETKGKRIKAILAEKSYGDTRAEKRRTDDVSPLDWRTTNCRGLYPPPGRKGVEKTTNDLSLSLLTLSAAQVPRQTTRSGLCIHHNSCSYNSLYCGGPDTCVLFLDNSYHSRRREHLTEERFQERPEATTHVDRRFCIVNPFLG